jgi:hypothetical protein
MLDNAALVSCPAQRSPSPTPLSKGMMFSNFAQVIVEISNKGSSRNKEVQEAEGDTTMVGSPRRANTDIMLR